MAVTDEILAFLVAEGLGTAGTTLFRTKMPAKPDACGVVYETPGAEPDRGFGASTIRFENPTVQIVFRGARDDYDTPRNNAETAFISMASVEAPQTLSGTAYQMIQPLQSPFPLGPDEEGRERIACNYAIQKDQS